MKHKTFLEFAEYTSLNVLGMIGLSCYILADTFFVSQNLGANGLAALNLAIPIYSFINGSGLMLGIGGATKYSVAKTRGETNKANRIFTDTFVFAITLAVLFMFAGIFFSNQITKLLGADENVFSMTNTYLKVLLIFSPAFVANNVFLAFVRNDENPNLSMLAMLGGSFSNVILDYVFMFIFNMGIFGAVFATGLAPIISILILSVHKLKKRNKFHFTKTTLNIKEFKTTSALGLPSLVTEVSAGIVMIVFNFLLLKICGNIGVAAYSVIANLSLVITAVFTGIAQGIQPLLSKSLGVSDENKMKLILKYALISVGTITVILYTVIFVYAENITNIFNKESNIVLQQTAENGMKLYFTAMLFAGFNIVLSMFFTSTANPKPAHVISLLKGFFVIIPMAFVLSFYFGITGIWLSYPITELVVCILAVIMKSRKTGKKTLPEI